jgi:hypothetical protein
LTFFFKIPLQILDLRAFLADDQAGSCRVDLDPGFVCGPLDLDLGDSCLGKSLSQKFPDLVILKDKTGIVLSCKPPGIPGSVNAQSKTDWIDLLSQQPPPPSLSGVNR